MSTQTLLAQTVMDQAAALMNDAARSIYTYPIQVPYVNQALQELQENFELNNVPVTDHVTSALVTVPAGTDFIGFEPFPTVPNVPYLPDDIIEPKIMWVSQSGGNSYVPVQRVDYLPRNQEGVSISSITAFTWQSEQIRFLAANADVDVKFDYIRNLFTAIVDETDVLDVINAASYLQYKTAALLARFMGENPTRADSLDREAVLALDMAIGIGTKGRQAISIRRMPFRSGYKRRNL